MSKDLTGVIKSFELELLQPGTRSSVKRLSELLSNDFLEIGLSGNRYNKQETLDLLPELGKAKYSVHNFTTINISPDFVLASYIAEMEVEEQRANSRSLRISLWRKSNDEWQICFHQGIRQIFMTIFLPT